MTATEMASPLVAIITYHQWTPSSKEGVTQALEVKGKQHTLHPTGMDFILTVR